MKDHEETLREKILYGSLFAGIFLVVFYLLCLQATSDRVWGKEKSLSDEKTFTQEIDVDHYSIKGGNYE